MSTSRAVPVFGVRPRLGDADVMRRGIHDRELRPATALFGDTP